MISARFLATALMALTILAFPGIHAAESGDCAGVVLDENGVPVASARIQFESTIGRTYRTETDSSGRFILRNLLTGDYKVEVRKASFFLLTGQSFTLHAGPNELTLTLHHEQELHERLVICFR